MQFKGPIPPKPPTFNPTPVGKPSYEELEATLERVKQLPPKWRNINKWNIYIESGMKVCADELEAAVKGETHTTEELIEREERILSEYRKELASRPKTTLMKGESP